MSKIKSQELFYIFLQEKQKTKTRFTKDDVIKATGWKPSTFKAYMGKGQITNFLVEIAENQYEAVNTTNINFVEFRKKLSQSKHYQELGHKCKNSLSKALLKKSKDNMMLAMELYNRPSLENKLDGFVMLFSTAWEQLLKAIIIERDGLQSIYCGVSKKGIKQTLSLRQCLDKHYKPTDKIRLNIECISDWRDNAVHLLMPELQGLASRIFQSGVINYSHTFEKFSEVPFLEAQHTGMMSLVGDFKIPPISVLKSLYGESGDEILKLAKTLQDEIESSNDMDFAIPINVSLVYAKNNNGSQIIIADANGSKQDLENLRKALIVEKPVDSEKTHPYTQQTAIFEINKRLHADFDITKLNKCLVASDLSGTPVINRDCFLSALNKLNWKASNNSYHHHQAIANRHLYSEQCISEMIAKITENDNFLRDAKEKNQKTRTRK
ncbi:hypothetical protein CF141_19710 [Aeromonas hydrophila]|uniref:DUF3644 domain-containing protein n=1 Tax=Aeromonas hydrophila TaxID=644 RepID=UPI001116F91B|nr:DUF3644 domain-containing protein [Aeromonas hydrophila]TNH68297.1 hypothetical protein CF141_19710 [Aeromonas hydrophila]